MKYFIIYNHLNDFLSLLQLLYCLRFYRGDEKIRTFIWELITPQENGELKRASPGWFKSFKKNLYYFRDATVTVASRSDDGFFIVFTKIKRKCRIPFFEISLRFRDIEFKKY